MAPLVMLSARVRELSCRSWGKTNVPGTVREQWHMPPEAITDQVWKDVARTIAETDTDSIRQDGIPVLNSMSGKAKAVLGLEENDPD